MVDTDDGSAGSLLIVAQKLGARDDALKLAENLKGVAFGLTMAYQLEAETLSRLDAREALDEIIHSAQRIIVQISKRTISDALYLSSNRKPNLRQRRWMMNGCLDWQQNGLVRPAIVLEATAEYFSEQDSVHQWVEENCDMGPRQSDTMASLFKSWSDFAISNGEKPGTSKWFSQTVGRLGCKPVKNTPGNNGKRGFLGISVKPTDTSGQWHNRNDENAFG